jgi:hypothetical protein
VAKYREILGFGSSAERKQMFWTIRGFVLAGFLGTLATEQSRRAAGQKRWPIGPKSALPFYFY